MDEADARDRHRRKERGHRHQKDDLRAQGHPAGDLLVDLRLDLFGQRRLLEAVEEEVLLDGFGNQPQRQRHDQHGDGLVRQVDGDVRRHLGPEYVQYARLVDSMGQRGRGHVAKAEAVEHPRQYRADDAADEGEAQHDDGQAGGLLIVALLHEVGRGHRDHHRQGAVVGGLHVADAVDQVRQKAHDDARYVPAQRRRQGAADVVQIQRQIEQAADVDADIVDQQSRGAEHYQIYSTVVRPFRGAMLHAVHLIKALFRH